MELKEFEEQAFTMRPNDKLNQSLQTIMFNLIEGSEDLLEYLPNFDSSNWAFNRYLLYQGMIWHLRDALPSRDQWLFVVGEALAKNNELHQNLNNFNKARRWTDTLDMKLEGNEMVFYLLILKKYIF